MFKVGHVVWIQGHWRATVLAEGITPHGTEIIHCLVHEGTPTHNDEHHTYQRDLVFKKKLSGNK